ADDVLTRCAGARSRSDSSAYAALPWHFLYFLPLPHQQGSLRPIFGSLRWTCAGPVVPPEPEKTIGGAFGFCGGMARCTRCTSSWRSPSRSTTTSVFQSYLTTRSW